MSSISNRRRKTKKADNELMPPIRIYFPPGETKDPMAYVLFTLEQMAKALGSSERIRTCIYRAWQMYSIQQGIH